MRGLGTFDSFKNPVYRIYYGAMAGQWASMNMQMMALEELGYKDESYDLVVGSRILHHVNVGRAGREIDRVLKKSGKAIFWECTERNPLLKLMRIMEALLPCMPKLGTPYEHPLTRAEIDELQGIFRGRIKIYGAPFFFFSLFDKYIFRHRIPAISMICTKLDALVDKSIPYLRRFNFHQILVLSKAP